MGNHTHSKDILPDAVCRRRYMVLSQECRRKGLDVDKIENSRKNLSFSFNGVWYLKNEAYKPTGIALGCPLPDDQITELLWRVSRLFDRCLSFLTCSAREKFAFVPRECYHITIVNWSHFKIDQHVIDMPVDKKEDVQKIIARLNKVPIVLHLNGLILTTDGSLIVPGFPFEDQIYEMRAQLAKTCNEFHKNMPATTHIKLGHVLQPLHPDKLKRLLAWTNLLGARISFRLSFHDIFTPVGRMVFYE